MQGPYRNQKHRDEMQFFRLSESLRGNENPSFKPKEGD